MHAHRLGSRVSARGSMSRSKAATDSLACVQRRDPPANQRGNLVIAHGGILYSHNPSQMVPPNTPLSPRLETQQPEASAAAVTIAASAAAAAKAEEEKNQDITRPLPLCAAKDVQHLLKAVEIPDFVIRMFKENSIIGQDLIDIAVEDLLDPRYKLPKLLIRKILRIPAAWKLFGILALSDTSVSLTLREYVSYLTTSGFTSSAMVRLTKAYQCCDTNNDGRLSFEEFAVGASFLVDVIESEMDAVLAAGDAAQREDEEWEEEAEMEAEEGEEKEREFEDVEELYVPDAGSFEELREVIADFKDRIHSNL
eukprot:gene27734-7380_t